jgi:hypothetical protein
MTALFEPLFHVLFFTIDPFLQYDEDGYPIEEEIEEYENVEDELDSLYDDDLIIGDEEELD